MTEILSALQAIQPNAASALNVALSFVSPTGEPQKGYMWEVQIDKPQSAVTLAPKNLDAHYNEALMYYAQSVSIPDFSVESIADNYLGETYYHAGKQVGGKNTSITFWDDQNLTVYGYLKNWANLLHAGTEFGSGGRQAFKQISARTMRVRLKDTTDFLVNLELQFLGAFCNGITEIQQSYDASDVFRVTAQFTFDDVVYGKFMNNQNSFVQGSALAPPNPPDTSLITTDAEGNL